MVANNVYKVNNKYKVTNIENEKSLITNNEALSVSLGLSTL